LVDKQRDGRYLVTLESGRDGGEAIVAGLELRQNEAAVIIGRGLARNACTLVGYGDRSTWNDCSRCVGDAPDDARRNDLRQSGDGNTNKEKARCEVA
jgi:hypothetical protein